MPYADPEARRSYYRRFKRTPGKKLSDKYYDAARHANTRAARLGIDGRITTADVRAVLDGARCVYCEAVEVDVDHTVAMADGGPNERANLVPACDPCNKKKERKAHPDRWSRDHDACSDCGGTERPHEGCGLCTRCYQRPRR